MGLLGDPPRTQLIASRMLRPGDMVAKADKSFAVVVHVLHAEEAQHVSVEFVDGGLWLGTDDTPFPVAASRNDAAEWNRRRAELDVRELSELWKG